VHKSVIKKVEKENVLNIAAPYAMIMIHVLGVESP
jgi:hypothetical protein